MGRQRQLRRQLPDGILLGGEARASIKGDNFERMKLDLGKKGYTLIGMLLNTCGFGLPQHRERAYDLAVREDVHLLQPQ